MSVYERDCSQPSGCLHSKLIKNTNFRLQGPIRSLAKAPFHKAKQSQSCLCLRFRSFRARTGFRAFARSFRTKTIRLGAGGASPHVEKIRERKQIKGTSSAAAPYSPLSAFSQVEDPADSSSSCLPPVNLFQPKRTVLWGKGGHFLVLDVRCSSLSLQRRGMDPESMN
jgi:hypothetical protein